MAEETLDQTLEKSWNLIQEKEESQADSTSEEVVDDAAGEEAAADDSATVEAQAGQETQVEPAAKGAEKNSEVKGTEAASAQVESPASVAPASFTSAAKADWQKTPPSIRAEILKRESDQAKFVRSSAEKLKQHDAIQSVLAHKTDDLSRHYGSVENGLKRLLELSDFAEKNPVGFIQQFAQMRGIQLAGMAQPQSQPNQFNPNQVFEQVLNPIKEELNQLKQERNSQQQKTLGSEVQKFVSEVKPAHFEDENVRAEMADIIEFHASKGRSISLAKAYDEAVKNVPYLAEQHAAQKALAAAEAQKKQNQANLDKAKKVAATNVVTKSNAGKQGHSVKPIDDTLEEAWNRLQSA